MPWSKSARDILPHRNTLAYLYITGRGVRCKVSWFAALVLEVFTDEKWTDPDTDTERNGMATVWFWPVGRAVKIPIAYMACEFPPFKAGDIALVFAPRCDYNKARIVGFAGQQPRPCEVGVDVKGVSMVNLISVPEPPPILADWDLPGISRTILVADTWRAYGGNFAQTVAQLGFLSGWVRNFAISFNPEEFGDAISLDKSDVLWSPLRQHGGWPKLVLEDPDATPADNGVLWLRGVVLNGPLAGDGLIRKVLATGAQVQIRTWPQGNEFNNLADLGWGNILVNDVFQEAIDGIPPLASPGNDWTHPVVQQLGIGGDPMDPESQPQFFFGGREIQNKVRWILPFQEPQGEATVDGCLVFLETAASGCALSPPTDPKRSYKDESRRVPGFYMTTPEGAPEPEYIYAATYSQDRWESTRFQLIRFNADASIAWTKDYPLDFPSSEYRPWGLTDAEPPDTGSSTILGLHRPNTILLDESGTIGRTRVQDGFSECSLVGRVPQPGDPNLGLRFYMHPDAQMAMWPYGSTRFYTLSEDFDYSNETTILEGDHEPGSRRKKTTFPRRYVQIRRADLADGGGSTVILEGDMEDDRYGDSAPHGRASIGSWGVSDDETVMIAMLAGKWRPFWDPTFRLAAGLYKIDLVNQTVRLISTAMARYIPSLWAGVPLLTGDELDGVNDPNFEGPPEDREIYSAVAWTGAYIRFARDADNVGIIVNRWDGDDGDADLFVSYPYPVRWTLRGSTFAMFQDEGGVFDEVVLDPTQETAVAADAREGGLLPGVAFVMLLDVIGPSSALVSRGFTYTLRLQYRNTGDNAARLQSIAWAEINFRGEESAHVTFTPQATLPKDYAGRVSEEINVRAAVSDVTPPGDYILSPSHIYRDMNEDVSLDIEGGPSLHALTLRVQAQAVLKINEATLRKGGPPFTLSQGQTIDSVILVQRDLPLDVSPFDHEGMAIAVVTGLSLRFYDGASDETASIVASEVDVDVDAEVPRNEEREWSTRLTIDGSATPGIFSLRGRVSWRDANDPAAGAVSVLGAPDVFVTIQTPMDLVVSAGAAVDGNVSRKNVAVLTFSLRNDGQASALLPTIEITFPQDTISVLFVDGTDILAGGETKEFIYNLTPGASTPAGNNLVTVAIHGRDINSRQLTQRVTSTNMFVRDLPDLDIVTLGSAPTVQRGTSSPVTVGVRHQGVDDTQEQGTITATGFVFTLVATGQDVTNFFTVGDNVFLPQDIVQGQERQYILPVAVASNAPLGAVRIEGAVSAKAKDSGLSVSVSPHLFPPNWTVTA